MTITFESISVVLLIIINLIAIYAIIKNIGAKDMETKKEMVKPPNRNAMHDILTLMPVDFLPPLFDDIYVL